MNDVKHAAYVPRQHDALEGNEIWEGGDGGDDDANGDRCRDDDDARRHDDNDDDDGDHHTSISKGGHGSPSFEQARKKDERCDAPVRKTLTLPGGSNAAHAHCTRKLCHYTLLTATTIEESAGPREGN